MAVLNRDSGSLRNNDIAGYSDHLKSAFKTHGHELEVRQVDGASIRRALTEAAKGAGELLVAGGGDGTVSAAAGIAWKHQKVLGILPAGTINLVARSLKIPLELDEAALALAGGEICPGDIATAGDTPFMHQFSVGLQTEMVKQRQKLTYESRFGKMLASFRAALATIARPPQFEVEIEIETKDGREKARRRLSGLAVSNNPYGEGHLPYADRLDQGILGVYTARAMSAGAAARLTTDIMLGSWRANPDFSEQHVNAVTLRFSPRRRPQHAVLDGELIPLPPQVNITLHRHGVRLLCPRTDTESQL